MTTSPYDDDDDLHRNNAEEKIGNPSGKCRKVKKRDEFEGDRNDNCCRNDSGGRLFQIEHGILLNVCSWDFSAARLIRLTWTTDYSHGKRSRPTACRYPTAFAAGCDR